MAAWTERDDDLLRRLWAGPDSTVSIGRRMGRSKNAIVGRAHRLGLPGRPSPIRSGSGKTPSAPRLSADAMTLPPLPSVVPAAPTGSTQQSRAAPIVTRRGGSCCWPIGDPRTTSFHYCDAPIEGSGPYCDAHARVAYTRPRLVPDATLDERTAAA